MGILNAFMERVVNLRWGPEGEGLDKTRELFKQRICDKLAPIEKLINQHGGKWICGEKLTWVDFFLAYIFSLSKQLVPENNEKLGTLRKHLEKLCENEGFKKYYESCSFNLPPLAWEQT